MEIKRLIDNEALKGHVTVEVLTYEERVEESKKAVVKAGENDIGSTYYQANIAIDQAAHYVDLARRKIKSISVKVLQDEEGIFPEELTELDQLLQTEEGHNWIQKIMGDLIGGITLGKKKLKVSEETARD